MAVAPLIIVSGPSGSGKSTVIRQLLAEGGLPLRLSVSATTRAPRRGERDGVDYHFWTRERFQEQVQVGAFLEWAEVHGQSYGTLRAEVDPYRARGTGVVLDIDVQGAAQVRRQYPDCFSVFLQAPSMQEYERRLQLRGTEDETSIARRLAAAHRELQRVGEYDRVIVNDDLATAVAELRRVIAGQFPPGGETPCSTS
jgi:guanylate kinase